MNNTWMVAWTHKRERYVLDVDTSGMAAVVGILLTETGRTGVTVNERPWELDEATQARIRETRIREGARDTGGVRMTVLLKVALVPLVLLAAVGLYAIWPDGRGR